jgi:vitamin K-dependent gamma-carboxylase
MPLRALASQSVDGSSLKVVRGGFGLLMAGALVRLHLTGWAQTLFAEPTFRFSYPGFEWVPGIPAALFELLLLTGVIGALCLGFGRGLLRVIGGVAFIASFAWLKLSDVTNYLNHDYLAVLLAGLFTVLPLDGPSVPRWALWLVRFQVGVVYVFAGLAKVNSEWLLGAQPLTTWFAANRGLPMLGAVLALPAVPLIASWAACFYDLTISFWLSWPRTRALAFAAVLGFHGMTHVLFDIGLFPFLMTLMATIFFSPAWPRRSVPSFESRIFAPLAGTRLWFISGYVLLQLLLPMRAWWLSDDVLWDEQGMRWSWRVMVREKNGSIAYRLRSTQTGRVWEVDPLDVLTPRQANEMSGQPDLIVQLAHVLGQRQSERLGHRVEVFVDAWVSLNGRAPSRLFRPDVDLLVTPLAAALLPSPRAGHLPALAEHR